MLAAIPYLIGFHPHASLVLIGLAGADGRVGPVVRADLTTQPAGASRQAAHLATCLRRAGAQRALVVCYGDDSFSSPDAMSGSGPALVGAVDASLATEGIAAIDTLLVAGGRWRSTRCADPGCCPPEGRPLRAPSDADGPSLIGATAAYAGMAPLASREQVAARLRPAGGQLGAATASAVRRAVADDQQGEPAPIPVDAPATVAAFAAAVRRHGDGTEALGIDAGAVLLAGLADIGARDACLAWIDTRRRLLDATIGMLTELVGRASPPYGAAPAALLGFCAWQRGDGALANLAVDRALADDPDYRLARLLASGLACGLPPHAWRDGTGPDADDIPA